MKTTEKLFTTENYYLKNKLLNFAKDDFNELIKLAENIQENEHLSFELQNLINKISDCASYYNRHVK